MTYKDLLNQLKTLSEDQLNCDIVIYNAAADSYDAPAIFDLDYCLPGLAIADGDDGLDAHPFFEIS